MTVYIDIPAKKREFVFPASVENRSPETTAYETTYEQILWDDGTDILWDNSTQIIWAQVLTAYPIEVQAKKRNFTIIEVA